MKLVIPGVRTFNIKNIFIDYNGTIATDGVLHKGLLKQLDLLALEFNVFILTGDTFGTVKNTFEHTSIEVIIAHTAYDKLMEVKKRHPEDSVAIGNGSIDHKMFDAAGISFCVIGREGASYKAIAHADIVVTDFEHVLEMIKQPKKIIATLKE